MKRPTEGTPGKRGRPPGSGAKLQVMQPDLNGTPRKRGRPPGSGRKLSVISNETNGTPKKRGRPPGSGTKVKVVHQLMDGIPRKRGRPPGSGTKVKEILQETNESPRKRGRPPGSGKIKTFAEEAEHVLTNSALSVNAQPRKRGRPKKAGVFPSVHAEEIKSKENDEPSFKRPRYLFASAKNSSKPDAGDQKGRETDGCRPAASVGNPVLSAKPDNIEQGGGNERKDSSVEGVYESNSRKSSSSRGSGKSQKKK